MRAIKFRFWSGRAMFYDVQANECLVQQLNFNAGHPKGFDHVGIYDGEFMQFTGLLDKQGREIYESDLLSSGYGGPMVVKFGEFEISEEGGCSCAGCSHTLNGWYAEEIPSSNRNYNDVDELDIPSILEIIGNIYSNPELLK